MAAFPLPWQGQVVIIETTCGSQHLKYLQSVPLQKKSAAHLSSEGQVRPKEHVSQPEEAVGLPHCPASSLGLSLVLWVMTGWANEFIHPRLTQNFLTLISLIQKGMMTHQSSHLWDT